jgi:hypothetical protein
MTDIYSDHYWETEFAVTQADMDRLESYIAETGQAHDLANLARRIIRGRLRYELKLARQHLEYRQPSRIAPCAFGIQQAGGR